MALKDRLSRLRRDAGAVPPSASLAARVAQLRPGVSPHAKSRVDAAAVAALLNGQVIAPHLVMIEQRFGLHGRHGAASLTRLAAPACMPDSDVDPRSLLFLDTETTGLSGGSGTLAFLLGLARIDGETLVVRQFLLTAFAGEAALLEAAGEWLRAAGAVATYNGKCFDVPLLATRCRLVGLRDGFTSKPHLDLLFPTRRLFGRAWEDCRLATAERRLLGFARGADLPGAEMPQVWFDLVRAGRTERLPAAVRHNHWDLISLAALLPALAEAHAQPAAAGADILAAARAHLHHGHAQPALALLDAHRERLDTEGALELARLYRQRQDWGEACGIWERLAAANCLEAIEHLAKFHEHRRRDYRTALDYAARLPAAPQHELRRLRLAAKLGLTGRQATLPAHA